MKILHTITDIDARSGGTSTSVLSLVTRLNAAERPVEAHLLALRTEGAPAPRPWLKTVPDDSFTRLGLSRNYKNFLRRTSYDLYHVNGLWMFTNHISCAEARRKDAPYIITPHGMLYPQSMSRSFRIKKIFSKLWFDNDISRAACLHATCRQEMLNIRALTGYNGPIAVIPNAVEAPPFTEEIYRRRPETAADGKIRIGFLGRLHPIKNIESILMAASHLPELDIEIDIMGAGDEAYTASLKELTASLGLKDKVKYTGFVSGREKYERLARLTALFLPSRMENFGMIVPEALTVGTPVMASLDTPWQALEENKCGWWRDNSPESLAGVIREISGLSSAQLRCMGRRGRGLALDNFNPKKIAADTIELYSWIINGGEKPVFVYLPDE